MLRALATAIALACFTLGAASADTDIASLTLLKADRVVVLKGERKLLLMRGEQVLRVYRVALGRYATGHKIKAGDERTPKATTSSTAGSRTANFTAPSTSRIPIGMTATGPSSSACRRAAQS